MPQANDERTIIPIDRLLSVFDRKTGEIVKDYALTSFDLAAFRKHFDVPENDPLLYDQYQISEGDLGFLAKYLPEWNELDFQQYDYVVTCYQSESTRVMAGTTGHNWLICTGHQLATFPLNS